MFHVLNSSCLPKMYCIRQLMILMGEAGIIYKSTVTEKLMKVYKFASRVGLRLLNKRVL